MYDAQYNAELGYKIGLSNVGDPSPFFGDLVTSPDTFLIADLNGTHYALSNVSPQLIYTFDSPLDVVSFEAIYVLPSIPTTGDSFQIAFRSTHATPTSQLSGFVVSNQGKVYPINNGAYQAEKATLLPNIQYLIKVILTRAATVQIYIDNILIGEANLTDYAFASIDFKFVGSCYLRYCDASWIVGNVPHIDFSKILFNLNYQTGNIGDTALSNILIGYRFTNEGIESTHQSINILNERVIGLELKIDCDYTIMQSMLYKLSQLCSYLEIEFAKISYVGSANVTQVDQRIIEATTSESHVIINTIYQIVLTEQLISNIDQSLI